jgi:hypothetical protein
MFDYETYITVTDLLENKIPELMAFNDILSKDLMHIILYLD